MWSVAAPVFLQEQSTLHLSDTISDCVRPLEGNTDLNLFYIFRSFLSQL